MRPLFVVLIVIACSSSNTPGDGGAGGGSGGGGEDSGVHVTPNLPDGGFSACGFPGDVGNDAGVGKYCEQISDCDSAILLCSSIANGSMTADHRTFYCVALCHPCSDTAPGPCGDDATCVCQGLNECGCVPNSCSNLFDAGGVSQHCDGGP